MPNWSHIFIIASCTSAPFTIPIFLPSKSFADFISSPGLATTHCVPPILTTGAAIFTGIPLSTQLSVVYVVASEIFASPLAIIGARSGADATQLLLTSRPSSS